VQKGLSRNPSEIRILGNEAELIPYLLRRRSLRKPGRLSVFKKRRQNEKPTEDRGFRKYELRLSGTLARNRIYGCEP
jgi:hypothetical protein